MELSFPFLMRMIFISTVAFFFLCSNGFTQTMEERIKILEEAALKKQEETAKELKNFQETLKKQEQTINEQRTLIEELKTEVKQLQLSAPPTAATQVQQQVQQLKEEVDQVVEAQKKNVLSVFNPAIGLVGEPVFSYRGNGSKATGSDRPGGFDIFQRSVELNLSASVDPFARGFAVINAEADSATGEATLSVEEAAIVLPSLPWNLALQGGRFFGELGRLSYIHDHELPFVNRPLVLDQYIGGEAKTDGVQLNYLLPISHYVSLTAGVGDQFGDAPNNVGDSRHFKNLNFWGRASTYFDLTPDISLETGVSGLWNPKTKGRGDPLVQPDGSTFTERERRLGGVDLVLSYRPLENNQFRSLTWGTELLYSNNLFRVNPAGVPNGSGFSRSVGSLGLYSYLAYKFHRQWTAGFLFDWVESASNKGDRTFAYSPYFSWAVTHWNQLRLQYTHTHHNAVSDLSDDNAVFLQWAWIIGSHAHGWQQR